MLMASRFEVLGTIDLICGAWRQNIWEKTRNLIFRIVDVSWDETVRFTPEKLSPIHKWSPMISDLTLCDKLNY